MSPDSPISRTGNIVLAFAQLLPISAHAGGSGLDARIFDPSAAEEAFVLTPDSRGEANGLSGALLAGYTSSVLDPGPGSSDLATVTAVAAMDALASWNLHPARLTLHLPIVPFLQGYDTSHPHLLGDARLTGRVLLLDRARHPVGLHLQGGLTAPTGNGADGMGNGGPGWEAGAGFAMGRSAAVAAWAGYASARATPLDGSTWDDRLEWRVAVTLPATDRLGFATELAGARVLTPDGARPFAGLISAHWRVHGPWILRAGGGSGMGEGPVTPGIMALAGLSWLPTPPDRRPVVRVDSDQDGLVDDKDQCPTQAEDTQGVSDSDGCPEIGVDLLRIRIGDLEGRPVLGAEVIARAPDGPHRLTAAGDGSYSYASPPGTLRLVAGAPGHAYEELVHEAREGATEVNVQLHSLSSADQVGGSPARARTARSSRVRSLDPDQDADSIPDGTDECPDQPEDLNQVDDGDGCPDQLFTHVLFRFTDPSGAPVPTAVLNILSGGLPGSHPSKGGVLHRSLPPDSYDIEVEAPGFMRVSRSIQIQRPRFQEVPISLSPPRLEVGLLVRARDAADRPLPVDVALDGPIQVQSHVLTDQPLLKVPSGSFTVRVSAPGFRSAWRDLDLVPRKDPMVLSFRLEPLEEQLVTTETEIPLSGPITFEGGTTVLSTTSYAILHELADILRTRTDWRVIAIDGFLVSPRSEPGLDRYSWELAEAVRTWLVNNEGIEPHRIVSFGMGSRSEKVRGQDLPANESMAWVEPRVVARVKPIPTVR